MPLTYTMETNRFVYSDITTETLKAVIGSRRQFTNGYFYDDKVKKMDGQQLPI